MLLSPERYEELNQEVLGLIEVYGITDYPVDVFALAGQMGIVLRPYSSIPLAKRHAFLDVSKDAFTIAEGQYEADATYICYNGSVNRGRLRHSIAHEIGHIWLEHPNDDEPHESEAGYFSGYLLAPTPLVLQHTNLRISEVEKLFEISHEAARIAVERASKRVYCRKPVYWYEHVLTQICTVERGGRVEIA